MNFGRKKIQKFVSTSPWALLMVPKNVSLIFTDKKDIKQKRNLSRNINWFNPPFNKNVSSNVAKRFLK